MATSKNDTPFGGGTANIRFEKSGQKVTLVFSLKNPMTNKSYTYAEMIQDLKTIAEDSPVAAADACEWISFLGASLQNVRGRTLQHPVRFHCDGHTEEEAAERARKEKYPQWEQLARLLYKRSAQNHFQNGNCTLEEFVQFVSPAVIFGDKSVTQQKKLTRHINKYILPACGAMLISDFFLGDDYAAHEKLKGANTLRQKTIKKLVKYVAARTSSETTLREVKQAFSALFRYISEHIDDPKQAKVFAELARQDRLKRSSGIAHYFRPKTLTEYERKDLFTFLDHYQRLDRLLIIGLIYSGLKTNEITALRLSDLYIAKLESGEEFFFVCVDKYRRHNDSKDSVLSVTSELFPFEAFRILPLSPIVSYALNKMIDQKRKEGDSDSEIYSRALAALGQNSSPSLSAVRDVLNELTEKLRFRSTAYIKNGKLDHQPRSWRDIETDSEYVLEKICGLDEIELRQQLPRAAASTLEENYLAIDSTESLCQRYRKLCRFSPLSMETSVKPACETIYAVHNKTTAKEILHIHSNFAVTIKWREK